MDTCSSSTTFQIIKNYMLITARNRLSGINLINGICEINKIHSLKSKL